MTIADVAVDDSRPEEGGHYYVTDDPDREVVACLLVLEDGKAVVASGGSARVVDPSLLQRVPTTVGDVRRVIAQIGAWAAAVDAGGKPDTEELRRLTAAVDVWTEGIPVPDNEKA